MTHVACEKSVKHQTKAPNSTEPICMQEAWGIQTPAVWQAAELPWRLSTGCAYWDKPSIKAISGIKIWRGGRYGCSWGVHEDFFTSDASLLFQGFRQAQVVRVGRFRRQASYQIITGKHFNGGRRGSRNILYMAPSLNRWILFNK